ncbi:MAG: PLDc N-terminal domain-containing protein [Wenzhouxiangellaceae bacterium]|nr:PLDc N-terminal domain-containing protein [Wenzhouxiangellaceae bacterium]
MGLELGLLGLIWLVIVVWAIVKTAQARVGPVPKILWILILIVFPVIGFLFWLFLGPKG